MADAKVGKPGVFRWGGILASRGRVVQAMVFVAVSVATIAFAFAQLGLVGLGEPNEGMTYAVVQLVPVAIAALLFGPLGGALLGLIAGAALLVHSHVQPLDFFEVYFITPVSSCVLLLAAGLVLGLMFAVALRHHPGVGAAACVPAVSGHPAVRYLRRHAAGARGGRRLLRFLPDRRCVQRRKR